MQAFDFIFSDKPQTRFNRHVIFWVAWGTYFAATFLITQQGFDQAGTPRWIFIVLVKSFLLLLSHAFIVYSLIWFLLPRYLEKRRYFFFTAGLLITCAITIAWSYFSYSILFLQLDNFFNLPSAITKKSVAMEQYYSRIDQCVKSADCCHCH